MEKAQTDRGASDRLHPRIALLRAATRLFRERGYTGVGVAEILEASRAPRGSLYFHFPGGKEQIAEESVRLAGVRMTRFVDNIIADTQTLEEFIDGLFVGWAAHLEETGFTRGCGVALIALETSATSERLRGAAEAVFNGWRSKIEAVAVARGLHPDDAARFGFILLASMQGAIVLCKAMRAATPLIEAAHGVKAAAQAMRADAAPA